MPVRKVVPNSFAEVVGINWRGLLYQRCSGTHIHDLGRRSRDELNTTSDRCDWAAPRVGSASDSQCEIKEF
ncbi:hypothetical protein Taro_055471 [Colocasia esculenta]|uniref:Uncharacterized protein n=1 Tax=Colocasia esculenta TaxID=4460 RepID=A0A843XRG8_COLES|nr:hypothetical protein [Colocasia esculenta]